MSLNLLNRSAVVAGAMTLATTAAGAGLGAQRPAPISIGAANAAWAEA
jgi:hypothetical protein